MSSSPTEERLDELLLRWDELRRQGRDISAEELCGDVPELLAELRRRIEVVRAMDSVLETESTEFSATPRVPGSDGARARPELPDALHASAVYRPQRRHAEGGLGEVLAARQEELDRVVALKRIRPDKLHDVARQRFLREAAITRGCSTRASYRSTAWDRTTTGRSTQCPSSRDRPCTRPSRHSMATNPCVATQASKD